MTLKSFLVYTVVITFVSFVGWFILQHQKYENEVIKVNVTLQNNCELIDSAFMVSTFPDGKKVNILKNKKAVIPHQKFSKIHLYKHSHEGFQYAACQFSKEQSDS